MFTSANVHTWLFFVILFPLKKSKVFFPVFHRRHFFLLCYNLREDKLEIIDNLLIRTTFKVVYGDFLVKLMSFKNYTVYNYGDVIALQF